MRVEAPPPETVLTPADSGPAQVVDRLVSAINRGEREALASCLARDCTLITPDATSVHGRSEAGAVLAQLIGMGAQIGVEGRRHVSGGGVTVISQRWRIGYRSAPGGAGAQNTTATLVVRQIEASWRIAIAAPWGTSGGALRR